MFSKEEYDVWKIRMQAHLAAQDDDMWEHCDVPSMQMDSDLVIYRTTLIRTFQVSTRSVLGKCVYLVTLAMSLFDLQDVCIAIGSIATLDLPMVVDLIGIYGLKEPYRTLTTIDWFLQALSVIPRGSWGDVARRFTMIRWIDGGILIPVVDLIRRIYRRLQFKSQFSCDSGWSQAPRRQQDQIPADADRTPADVDRVQADSDQTPADVDRVQSEADRMPNDPDQVPADGNHAQTDSPNPPKSLSLPSNLAAMAVVFIQNALQVNFKAVLSFPNKGMVKMFKVLESSGVMPEIIYVVIKKIGNSGR
ncbi:hypothetical protein F511_24800 [Dorcoceras hygrometricum]|uniref:Uncharacterized protein n=1 Tax=Dorcoceras hygrometricum TaxID=472368 RepID=A0A2Z7BDJ3_9LAMI|nr:hypothetical protein F511_24800 [Dorcoceras hygrometricum]